jgi:hypothetical protein
MYVSVALLHENQVFKNYKEFSEKIIEYEVVNNCLFVKTDSCRNLNSATIKDFPYSYIVMSCKQGRSRPTESEGARPNQR